MNVHNAFDDLDAWDRAHMADTGRGYIVPGGSERAQDLADALIPLEAITPALSRRYLVKGWLERGALSVLYGESNVGKTFLALDLAMHVAAGCQWHGVRVQGGPVVYIAGEGGRGIRNRIEALRCALPNLTRGAEKGFHLLPVSVDLCRADGDALVKVLQSLPSSPALVVVDTLARAMGEGDENSGQDMGAMIRTLDLIRGETGAHVLVVHHAGKDTSKGARGHSRAVSRVVV